MEKTKQSSDHKLIRITYEKPVNGGIEKREIILTGYHGAVLILLAVLTSAMILLLSGVKIF